MCFTRITNPRHRVNSKKTISLIVSQKVKINEETKNVDDDYGGGVTIGEKGTDQVIIISGNENKELKDTEGNPLRDTPADILVHEIVGHAVPQAVGSDTGNAVKNENKARAQYDKQNNCLRKEEPDHKESKS